MPVTVGEFSEGFGYDVGFIRYEYPSADSVDTNEWYASGSYSTGDYGDFSAVGELLAQAAVRSVRPERLVLQGRL